MVDSPRSEAGATMKVLIADDEKKVATSLQEMLERMGHSVVSMVEDGNRAIEACRRYLPDVVLMDIEMPVLDGLSAAHQIARDPGTPVLIITAHGEPELVEAAIEEGVIQYLLKPVTGPALNAALMMALARSREIKELKERSEALEATLRDRKIIEKAKGILMSRRHFSEAEAFRFLQRQSQDRRMPMVKLAESIVQANDIFESME
jgi:response regulator NasT